MGFNKVCCVLAAISDAGANWDLGRARVAFIRLLRGRGCHLGDTTVGLTSYRSGLASLLENLPDCFMINETIDAEARRTGGVFRANAV